MAQAKRFEKIFREGNGFSATFEIYRDTETGVCYLYGNNGYPMGLTPLLDSEGKPVVMKEDGPVDWSSF